MRIEDFCPNIDADQKAFVKDFCDWFSAHSGRVTFCDDKRCQRYPHTHAEGPAPVYSLGGWAGTGKTKAIQWAVMMAGTLRRTTYTAYTHKACDVLRRKLDCFEAERTKTFASLFYYSQEVYDCRTSGLRVEETETLCTCAEGCTCPSVLRAYDPQDPDKILHQCSEDCTVEESLAQVRREYFGGWRVLGIADEASMLTNKHITDIREFGVPLLLIGDPGQLPPVGPEGTNDWMLHPDSTLTQNHRQAGDGRSVIEAARDVREHGRLTRQDYGDKNVRILGRAANQDVYERLIQQPGRAGTFRPDHTRAIIVHDNTLRAGLNRAYHGSGGPRDGDYVVCLQNRRTVRVWPVKGGWEPRFVQSSETGEQEAVRTFVYNSMTGYVVDVLAVRGDITDLVIRLPEHANGTAEEPVHILVPAATHQFGHPARLTPNKRPKKAQLWDYAYAITAHKAQGSEYREIIVMDTHPSHAYSRWMYTALTRASGEATVIDFHR